jgi:ribosomal protein S18 acetylase RimI-like enzyme
MALFQTLENTKWDVLHRVFAEAFSDYQVKIDLPYWKFEQMLVRRGFCPEASLGAFEDGRLVGFVLNGLRDWHGKKTAYDLGTGVVKEYRRQGLTSVMLQDVKALLKQKNAEQYLLEVIKTNESALALYLKQGFEIQREFACFRMEKSRHVFHTNGKVDRAEGIDFDRAKEFWDFDPSWQNAVDSIKAVPEAFAYVTVRSGEEMAGYGIVDMRTGDIPQIAVQKAHRGKGIALRILAELAKSTEASTLSVHNVQEGIKPMEDFLLGAGFDLHVGQYEMLLVL